MAEPLCRPRCPPGSDPRDKRACLGTDGAAVGGSPWGGHRRQARPTLRQHADQSGRPGSRKRVRIIVWVKANNVEAWDGWRECSDATRLGLLFSYPRSCTWRTRLNEPLSLPARQPPILGDRLPGGHGGHEPEAGRQPASGRSGPSRCHRCHHSRTPVRILPLPSLLFVVVVCCVLCVVVVFVWLTGWLLCFHLGVFPRPPTRRGKAQRH